MRRPLLLSVLALALTPASASADGFLVQFGVGDVAVSDFRACPGENCDPTPISIALDRPGAGIVGAAGPALDPRIERPPAPGDVVRVSHDGVERAAVTYEPPTVDDTSCAVVGRTTLAGTFRHGEPGLRRIGSPGYGLQVDEYTHLRVAVWDIRKGLIESTVSVDGARWTAQFPAPLTGDGQALVIGHGYTVQTPVGSAAVLSSPVATLCPAPPPPPPPPPPTSDGPRDRPPPPCGIDALRADPAFDASVRRAIGAIRLKHLRRGRAALKDLVVCTRGLVSASIRTTGRRPAVVARGIAPTRAATVATLPLERTQRAARLAGRRRARVKLVLAFRDSAGKTLTWTTRATLR